MICLFSAEQAAYKVIIAQKRAACNPFYLCKFQAEKKLTRISGANKTVGQTGKADAFALSVSFAAAPGTLFASPEGRAKAHAAGRKKTERIGIDALRRVFGIGIPVCRWAYQALA